jgi:hypothetical protein
MVTASGHIGIDGVVKLAVVLQREDLLAVNRHIIGRLDPDPHRVAVDLHDRDPDLVAYLEPLTELPAQDQHGLLLLEKRFPIGPNWLRGVTSREGSDLPNLVTGTDCISGARCAGGPVCKIGARLKRPGTERFSIDGVASGFRGAAGVV